MCVTNIIIILINIIRLKRNVKKGIGDPGFKFVEKTQANISFQIVGKLRIKKYPSARILFTL